tara:strand:- start:15695 stop:15823 length:129 start_codon:yes stop_codon:yes gene_type:complete
VVPDPALEALGPAVTQLRTRRLEGVLDLLGGGLQEHAALRIG